MLAIISLLVILSISFLVTRIGTVALSLTGLSVHAARLQAVSAFTGVGFTTSESELIVRHPLRRRILIVLMVLGNAGIVTAVSSLILSFVDAEQGEVATRLLLLLAGMIMLIAVSRSRTVENRLGRLIRWALGRWTRFEARDYANLLQLSGEYSVTEVDVEPDDWLAGKTLSELELTREGVTVLGIHRGSGDYVGVPLGGTEIEAGDRLVLYGRDDAIGDLDLRGRGASGEAAHRAAMARQEDEERDQQERERRRRRREAPEAGEAPEARESR